MSPIYICETFVVRDGYDMIKEGLRVGRINGDDDDDDNDDDNDEGPWGVDRGREDIDSRRGCKKALRGFGECWAVEA
ncbi:hypothetical protein ACO22_06879 [Paracoccidioides brasiliensis]|uniref:Uncharacterized protein n=1 Tax=Paracoccidioides brasiliensis TaxID=121759 RepID=A0A1D2J689_PARBR|nr:hypothetical protein ACO22_06879 [Paracoccidioides brasiliensis]